MKISEFSEKCLTRKLTTITGSSDLCGISKKCVSCLKLVIYRISRSLPYYFSIYGQKY